MGCNWCQDGWGPSGCPTHDAENHRHGRNCTERWCKVEYGPYFEASTLSGKHIGRLISWNRGDNVVYSEEITMITHKKNKNVLVRHGKNNSQKTFKPDAEVFFYYPSKVK